MTTAIAALCALILWAVWALLSKYSAASGAKIQDLLMLEAVGHIAGALLLSRLIDSGDGKLQLRTVVFAVSTGAVSILALWPFLLALRSGRVSVVMPLVALYPAVTAILAVFLLKEPIDLRSGIGIALAVAAAALLAR